MLNVVSLVLLVSFVLSVDAQAETQIIRWQEMLSKCDKIYEGSAKKWLPLGVFESLPSEFIDLEPINGVRFSFSTAGETMYKGAMLVGVYGVDDCSEGSDARINDQCAKFHPPTVSFVFVGARGKVPKRFREVKAGLFGQSWYDMAPEFDRLIDGVELNGSERLFEFTCMWNFRPEAG